MDISHHCPEERFRRLCYRLWLLKNSFCGLLTEKFVCKLLNFGSALTRKFAEITGLIPFSTASPGYASYPGILYRPQSHSVPKPVRPSMDAG
jgi:hypothetical protein